LKRCSKCDKSDHRHCHRGICECPCQDHWGDVSRDSHDYEIKLDPKQDKFFEDMKAEWKALRPKKPKLENQNE